MRSGTAATLLVAWAAGAAAAPAAAEPVTVRAERCAPVDAAALARDVRRELALAPGSDAPAVPLAVDVACPDGVHASISVARRGDPTPVARDLDLSDEPTGLQSKLLALAIAELVAELPADPAPPGDGEHALDDAAPPSLHAPARLAPISDDELPAFVRAEASARLAPTRLTVRGGVRLIVDGPPMETLSADLDTGPLRVGLVAALGDDHRDGMPYLLAAAISRPLVCSRRRTTICVVARGEAGIEGASPHRRSEVMEEHAAHATYADLAVGLEARRRLAGWNWVAGLDLGGGDGFVYENNDLERLDGPFAVTTLGASW